MKKHLQFLLLIAAFLMPGLAKAQITATVADGTSTNDYVPVYGYYADAYLRAQIVYPESMMAELTGGEISQMTFHSSSSSISWGSANFEVKLGAATSSTLGSNWDAATLTTVYTGSLSISASGEMTVTFSTPYVYTGGDLLVEVNETTYGNYVSCTWLGVNQSGASIQGYDYDDWSYIYPDAQNFIPKTTFTYTPGDQSCPFPISVVAENVTAHDAFIHWTDTSSNNAWMLYYYPTAASENVDSVLLTDTSYYLAGLEEHTAYTVKVGAVCDTSNSVLRSAAFATPWGCPPVENLAVTYLSVDTAILVWKEAGVATSWVVEYDSVPFTPGAGTAMIEYASDTTITLAGLDTGGLYYVAVRPDCGGDDTILYTTTVFTTLAALPATVPFACDFEGEGTNGWDLYNGSQTNKWCVGGAVNNGGSQSLYISNNNGTSNNYDNGSISYTYAKRTISLSEDGEYAYSFDWRGQGESGYYDYLRAFLVPAAEDYLTDGSCPGGGTYDFSNWNAPSTWHDLSGVTSSPYTLNQSSSWQTRVGTLQLTAGTYNLVFAWANDGSGGSNPAAAVDNVSLIRNACPQVQNLVASYVSTDTVILEWSAGGEETEWVVINGTEEVVVNDTTYLFEGLMPATAYTFYVRSICSGDDTSLVTPIIVRTSCGEFGPLPLAENFSGYASSSYPDCWTRVMSGSYPYVTSSYGNSIQFAGSATVISPRMPAPLNNLFVTFDLRKEGSSSGSIEFGYTHDPNSASDMVVLYTINPTTTGTYFTYEYDLSADTCADSVYLAWRQNSSSTIWYYWLDNISVTRASSCSPVTNLRCSSHSNVEATIAWNDTASDAHAGIWVYIATSNNMAAAFDSMYVFGANNCTFTGLSGNTHYYIWAVADCSGENSREITCEFTTDVNCAPVRNLAATSQMHSISLAWEAPTAGEPATMYHVAWKKASESAWNTDSTTNTYYYIGGLDMNVAYQYRVTTSCDGSLSTQNAGTISTTLCGSVLVGTDDGTNSYVPTYIYYGYSYTQQIHLATELMNVGDTIVGLAFNSDMDAATSRPVDIYLGNTSQNNFSSTSNYISADSLQLVYTGNLSVNEGWNMVTFTTPFVRDGRNIVVAVDDNTGSYVSANGWVSTATPDARSLYFYQDGTNITPSSPSASSSGLVNGVNQLTFYTTDCNDNGCEYPNVVVSDANMDEISIVWYPEVSGASYTITYAPVGSSVVTTAATGVTTHNYTLTGLSTGIDYVITVSFDCQGDTLSGSVVASTECGAVAVPYTEDFQTVDYGEFSRSCWVTGTSYANPSSASYPYPYVVSLTGDENNKLCLLYEGSYLILPQMDAPINDLQIRFTLLQGGDNVPLLFGLIADPSDTIASMNILETFVRSDYTAESSINITYTFDNVTDTAGYIAFWSRDGVNYSFLDNIVVEYIPNCTAPTNVTATNVTTNGADINWVGSATNYIVEYGPRGFALGTGSIEYSSTNSITLTGLASSSNYEAYVYAICGTDTSVASNVVRFTTECDVVTLPYTMNFDNVAEAGVTRAPLPNCWSYVMLDASYSGNDYVPATYYTTSAGYTTSGSYCLWLYGTSITALPEMPTSVDSLMITFHDYNSYTSEYKLIIGAVDSVTPGFEASFVGIDTINFTGTETNVLSFLSDYTGTGRYIAFKNYNSSPYGYGYSYHYIDDIVVDRIPSCVYPVNLRTTTVTGVSADITWSVCQANEYEFEYGPTGFVRGTGTFDTCMSRIASISGLNYGTTYDIYVRGICAVGDTSEWSSCFTFSTLNADPVSTFPYYCDFADTTLTNAGWEISNGSQVNKWYVGTAASNGTADNYGLYISNDNGATNAYSNSSISYTWAYRTFTMDAGEYAYGFDWKCQGESQYYDFFRVFLVPVGDATEAGTVPGGSTYNFSTEAAPAGWFDLSGVATSPFTLNQQSTWQTVNGTVTIPATGTYKLAFAWANDGSGGSNPPAAIDNVEIVRNTCPAPTDITATAIGTTSMTIDWVDINPAIAWMVEYGETGFTRGSGTMMNVTSHPVTLVGLDTLTSYDVYVRPVCSTEDTGRWSDRTILSTAICDNAIVTTIGRESSGSTSYYTPVNTYFRYTLTETIIDSAELNGEQDISVLSYYYDYASPLTAKTNCTIYFQPTNKTSFSSTSDAEALDTATAVMVYTGALNCSQGWNNFVLDTVFHYDGTSNLLVIVDDNSYAYNSSSYVFKTDVCSSPKTLVYYSDSNDPDVADPFSYTGSKSTYSYRVVMKLTSCGGASCGTPVITGETHDYQSVTVTWNGSGNSYEVAIKETAAGTWPDAIAVAGNTYTFSGLNPSTSYSFRVRQDCNADSLGYSDWANGGVVTDSLPCFAPDSLHATDVTNATATLDWNTIGNETNWDIHVWAAGFDSIYRVNAHPATVGGFTAGVTYNATVRALCGVNLLEGDWSDATQFTTATCPDVTGLATSNVTAHSVTLNWTADPMAESWKIEYGYRGTPQGQGTVVTVTTNTYTVTGLSDETSYQFYVQAVCGTGWESEQWAEVFATTAASTGDECDPVTNLTVSDITTNSAMVTWFSESGSAWNVVVPEANVDVTVYEQQYALTGLLANTNYNVKVRTVCDNDQYSDFVTTSFMTEQEEGIDGVETMNCTIYPNPTSSATTISVSGVNGKVKIAIVDMNGRTVASETMECASDCVKTMDVENLAQGAYFVRITGESVNMVKKLVVR